MPDFNTAPYSNQLIQIPPELPKVLKQYTKAAIRTQPRDILLWSVAYFRCLTNGEIPPVKERLEYPIPQTESGLTPGLLRVLHKQLGRNEFVQKSHLQAKWRGICLGMAYLEEILHQGQLTDESISWQRFLVEAAASITPTNVVKIMEVVCGAVASHPESVASKVPKSEFMELFRLTAIKMDIPDDTIKAAQLRLEDAALMQGGFLKASNIDETEF